MLQRRQRHEEQERDVVRGHGPVRRRAVGALRQCQSHPMGGLQRVRNNLNILSLDTQVIKSLMPR